jgi:hypothetical protein
MNAHILNQIQDGNLTLTLEFGRGQTYRNSKPTLYGSGVYGRSSVLAGQSRRVYLECWDDMETAKRELAAAALEYEDLTGTNGTTHIPVDNIINHLPSNES